MDVVIAAVSAGICGIVGGLASAYVLIKRTNTEANIKEMELREKTDKAARAEEARTRKTEANEVKELYKEVKKELAQTRAAERRCNERVRRLELVIVAAGMELPPLLEHPEDSETDGGGDGTGHRD